MEQQNNTQILIKSARLLIILSALIMLFTIFGIMLKLEYFRVMCVCTTNYIAYSWIGFGVSIIAGLKLSFFSVIASRSDKKYFFCKNWLFNLMLAFQSISFIAGIVYLLLFAMKLSNVI